MKNNKYILALMATLLLVSCSKNETAPVEQTQDVTETQSWEINEMSPEDILNETSDEELNEDISLNKIAPEELSWAVNTPFEMPTPPTQWERKAPPEWFEKWEKPSGPPPSKDGSWATMSWATNYDSKTSAS